MSYERRSLNPELSPEHLFGAELRAQRDARGWSLAALGRMLHHSRAYLCKIELAQRPIPGHLPARCDELFATNGLFVRLYQMVEASRARAGGRRELAGDTGQARGSESARAVGMMKCARPLAWASIPRSPQRAASDGTRAGDPTERFVFMSGDESARYHDHISDIGAATLDQLRDDTRALARQFANAPRLELFGSVKLLRDRIFGYLDGRTRIREHRDLAFLAGTACGLLGDASLDLGYPGPAMNHFRLALTFAQEAGADTLAAWVRAEQAITCYWDDRFRKARDFARQGQEFNPSGTVAVYLPALEGMATGQAGDAEAARQALDAAADARERVTASELDEYGGILSFNAAKQHGYVVRTLVGIGAEASAVAEAADQSVEAYGSLPEAERAYDNMTNSRLHAAIAHVRSGELDAAEPYVRVALALAPELRTAQIEKTVRRLHGYLCAPAVRTSAEATDMRDRIEDFLSISPVHPAIE